MNGPSLQRRAPQRDAKQGDASPPSTREIKADGPFCEVLAQDLGLKVTTVRTALLGEPKVRCIRVAEWVLRNAGDDLERRAKLLVWWAKKRRAGAFRQDPDAEREIARRIARYWAEHPDRLAETLRESMREAG